MVDNFHGQHRLRKAYFIDGLGNHQPFINLSRGDSIWIGLEFEAGVHPPSSVRILFDSLPDRPELRSPVN
jgi:hypothetical protein